MAELPIARPVRAAFPAVEGLFTIGVTGTNGKTSTTHLIASILASAGERPLCQSTLGYIFDGAPLQVERSERGFHQAVEHAVARGARYAAVEVTSRALRSGYARKWRFDMGVFTNLTRDHLAEHGSWEHYLASKAQLFVHLGPGRHAILNASDPAAQLLDRVTPSDVLRSTYAVPSRGQPARPADLTAAEVVPSLEGTRVVRAPSPQAERLGGELSIRLIGEVFGENALAAALAGLGAGLPPEAIRLGLSSCAPPAGRFEIFSRAPLVVLDYAHTPDALARLCDTARRLVGAAKLIVVFGAGGGFDPDKREPMGEAAGSRADRVILTNDNPRAEDPAGIIASLERGARRAGRAAIEVCFERAEAIARALAAASAADAVIIAGRGHDRGMYFANGVMPYSDVEVLRALLHPGTQ